MVLGFERSDRHHRNEKRTVWLYGVNSYSWLGKTEVKRLLDRPTRSRLLDLFLSPLLFGYQRLQMTFHEA